MKTTSYISTSVKKGYSPVFYPDHHLEDIRIEELYPENLIVPTLI